MIGDKDWNWGMTMETQIEELLAEVKRLRQLNHDLQVEMQKLRDMFGGVEKTVEDVRRLLND